MTITPTTLAEVHCMYCQKWYDTRIWQGKDAVSGVRHTVTHGVCDPCFMTLPVFEEARKLGGHNAPGGRP